MAKSVEVEAWVLVDDTGDYAVGKAAELATEAYENEVQELTATSGYRMVKLTVTVPLPEVVELSGVVPSDGEAATLQVKQDVQ